ncbi:MAG: hypothetical protein VB086_06950 [Clostridiaceae bacterium]|nr:hypothetical protein [Clostridiaceae bacterium]
MMDTDIGHLEGWLRKWQEILRLRDWDLRLLPVEQSWRKTGDIKIDADDRTAVLMVNVCDPKQTNAEELVIHELLHLKLWGMDQMIDSLLSAVYGEEEEPKREFAYTAFMTTLESTVNDLAKSFLEQAGEDKRISFGRLEKEISKELKNSK